MMGKEPSGGLQEERRKKNGVRGKRNYRKDQGKKSKARFTYLGGKFPTI